MAHSKTRLKIMAVSACICTGLLIIGVATVGIPDPIQDMDGFGHVMIFELGQSESEGYYLHGPTKFSETGLEPVPKVAKTLEYLLDAQTTGLPEPIAYVDDEPGLYQIFKDGPSSYRADSMLTFKEVSHYQRWAEKNLSAVSIHEELPLRYYIEYKDEVFTLIFETVNIIN